METWIFGEMEYWKQKGEVDRQLNLYIHTMSNDDENKNEIKTLFCIKGQNMLFYTLKVWKC